MLGLQQAVMNHLERDSCFDQRLIETERRILHMFSCLFTAIKSSSLLRIHHGNPSQRGLISEVRLIPVMPAIEFFDNRQPTAVDWLGIELNEPRTKTLCDAIGNPHANLVRVLHGIFPAVFLFDADAEDSGDCLASQSGPILLAILAVGPWGHNPASSLPVGKQSRGNLADCFHVEPAERTPSRIGNVARIRINCLDFCIPELPEFEQPFLAPYNVLTASSILGVVGSRQIHSAKPAKIFLTMHAVTHS